MTIGKRQLIGQKPYVRRLMAEAKTMQRDVSAIRIHNIYYMLAYAYRSLCQSRYAFLQTESFENIQDLMAAILAKGIAVQRKQGFSRSYQEKRQETTVLRGRIDLEASMSPVLQCRRRLVCAHDDLTENHIMHRILKTTAMILAASDEVKRLNRDALKRELSYMQHIDGVEPAAIQWSMLRFDRNYPDYQMLMGICWLVLKGLLQGTEPGRRKLTRFLDDQYMSRLFEKFILAYYKRHFPQYHPASKQIRWDIREGEGRPAFLPHMLSDILLTDDQNKEKKLIIDAKYYGRTLQTYYDVSTVSSANLYQIYTYVKNEDRDNTGLVSGLLLYAKTEDWVQPYVDVNIGGNFIGASTLDLDTPFPLLKEQLDEIVDAWKKR